MNPANRGRSRITRAMPVGERPEPVDGRYGLSARGFRWALVVVLALAHFVRFYGLGEQNYWLDELHSLANSAGRRAEFEAVPHGVIVDSFPRTTDLVATSTIGEVWRRAREDTHPPLYFLLLLPWRRLFGDGEAAVRAMSVLFSVASIVPAAMVLHDLGRRRAALVVALVLALSFTHVHMAQEARPYSMAIFFVCLSYWAAVRLAREAPDAVAERPGVRRCWVVLYGASLYLAVMTHYFAVLALLGQVPFVVARLRGRVRAKVIATGLVAAALFAASWGPSFVAQLPLIAEQPWLQDQRPDHLARTVVRLLNPPIRLLVAHERFLNDENFVRNASLALVGLLFLGGTLLVLRRARSSDAILFAGWYFAPLGGLLIMDLWGERQLLANIRYFCVAAPGFVGLLVLAIETCRRTLYGVAAAAVVVTMAATLRLPTQENPRNRYAADLITQAVAPGALLVYDAQDWPPFWAARIYHGVSYYLPAPLPGGTLPFVLLRDRPGAELLGQFARYDRLIVLAPHPPGEKDPNPLPDRFVLVNRTGYVELVGFIYLFDRN